MSNKKRIIETVVLTVPSHPKFLYVIRSAVYPVLIEAGFTKKETRRIILAIDEACSNIIKYAYGGETGNPITISLTRDRDAFLIELKDIGKKVDPSTIVPRKLDDVRPGGLGTHFMSEVFDSVHYDTSGDKGTTLTLVKNINPGVQTEVQQ